MIIHPRPIQPPPYNEMYAKSAKALKNTPLCPFLQGMDNQEEQLQQTVNRSPLEKVTWHPNFLVALQGAVIGTLAGGILAGAACATCVFIERSRVTVEIDHYGESLSSRKNRIIKKIQLIYTYRVDLQNQIELSLNDRLQIIRHPVGLIQCRAEAIQYQNRMIQRQAEISQLIQAETHFFGVLAQYERNNFFDNRPPQEPKPNEIFCNHYVSNGITPTPNGLITEGARIHNSYHICLEHNTEGDERGNQIN